MELPVPCVGRQLFYIILRQLHLAHIGMVCIYIVIVHSFAVILLPVLVRPLMPVPPGGAPALRRLFRRLLRLFLFLLILFIFLKHTLNKLRLFETGDTLQSSCLGKVLQRGKGKRLIFFSHIN